MHCKNFYTRLLKLFFIAAFLFSCASPYYTRRELANYLRSDKIISSDAQFSILRPSGWFAAVENKNNSADIWLIKEDYSETVTLNKINVEKNLTPEDILSALENYRKINFGNGKIVFEPISVKIEGSEIRGFKYKDAENRNVFVFLAQKNNLIVETVYITANTTPNPAVFAVISSIEPN